MRIRKDQLNVVHRRLAEDPIAHSAEIQLRGPTRTVVVVPYRKAPYRCEASGLLKNFKLPPFYVDRDATGHEHDPDVQHDEVDDD